MRRRPLRILFALAVVTAAGSVLAGCTDPYAHQASTLAGQETGSPGEPTAPPAIPAGAERPAETQPNAQAALERFANLYTNWTYRTLTADQRTLAAIAVGPARLTEQQAATASRADNTISRAHLANHGELLAVSPEKTRPGWWVIVTREQTTGGGEYEALPANDHVILAQTVRLRAGWAVQQWQPQN